MMMSKSLLIFNLILYLINEKFCRLKNYLIKEIKPQENYQYFIFKELINSGGQISFDELANKYDAEYENTNKTDTKQS